MLKVWFGGHRYAGVTDEQLAKFAVVVTGPGTWTFFPFTEGRLKELNPAIMTGMKADLCAKSLWDSDTQVQDEPKHVHLQCPIRMEEITANDWWLRDGNGGRLHENPNVTFLDVGKPDFKEAWSQGWQDLYQGSGYDYAFFDYWWPHLVWIYQRCGATGRLMPVLYGTEDAWFSQWQAHVERQVRTARLAGKKILASCPGEMYTTDLYLVWQRTQIDAAIYEGWAIKSYWRQNGDSPWRSIDEVERSIEAMRDDPLEVFVADSGVYAGDADYQHKLQYSLAMYYIALPNRREEKNRRYYTPYGDATPKWEALYAFDIGEPWESARQHRAGVWSRKFTEGLVLFNASDGIVTFTLDGRAYRDVVGARIYSPVVVREHSGLVLKCAARKSYTWYLPVRVI